MKSSLGLRLILTAAVTTILALAATAVVLNFLFRIYFEERVHDELDTYLLLLTGNVALSEAGDLDIAPMPDPRFSQALSGYYWQIEADGVESILSPSFWAAPLELTPPAQAGVIDYQEVMTGTGEPVSVASWTVELGEAPQTQQVLIAVAVERRDIDVSVNGFTMNAAIWLAILGVFLLAATALTVRVGLRPLERVRDELSQVNRARNARLSNNYPTEVQPLIKEVNGLLDQNEQTLARVRMSAGNLAHGLKTPLTVLRGISLKMAKAGQGEIVTDLNSEIDNMQHIVDRELARSRDSHQTKRASHVAAVANRLCAALRLQPSAAHLRWQIDVSEDLLAPFDAFELTELLGNLLDNAMKWTKTAIVVRGGTSGEHAFLSVSDDGPGIPENQLSAALTRGERLDPKNSGTGLGLNIVRDMAAAHECEIALENLPSGGLKVLITWPAERFGHRKK